MALLSDHVHFRDRAAFSGPFAFLELLAQEIRIHVDHRERIFDFVSEGTCEFGELMVLASNLVDRLLFF